MPARTPLVLVTDADEGVGFEIAEQLADRDYDVLLAAPAQAAARAATQRLWDQGLDSVYARALDPSSEASVERLRASVEKEFGRLDVIVSAHPAVAEAFRGLLGPDGRVVDVGAGGADAAVRAAAPS